MTGLIGEKSLLCHQDKHVGTTGQDWSLPLGQKWTEFFHKDNMWDGGGSTEAGGDSHIRSAGHVCCGLQLSAFCSSKPPSPNSLNIDVTVWQGQVTNRLCFIHLKEQEQLWIRRVPAQCYIEVTLRYASLKLVCSCRWLNVAQPNCLIPALCDQSYTVYGQHCSTTPRNWKIRKICLVWGKLQQYNLNNKHTDFLFTAKILWNLWANTGIWLLFQYCENLHVLLNFCFQAKTKPGKILF